MVRTLLACSAIALAFTAHADVTIKTTSTGKGFGISGSTTGTTYIKGLKMRTDTTAGNKNLSTIFDVDAQKMYILDVEDKEAKVWDMAAFASELSATVSPEGTQASMTAERTDEDDLRPEHGGLRHQHRGADDSRAAWR